MIKQKLFLLFALLLGTLVPHSVLGYSFSAVAPTGQTLYYNITNSSTHTVAVVPQNTSSPYYSSNAPSGVLEIPASVTYNGTTYSVTGIGQYAFQGCTGLTSVTIGNSVTSIGGYAFNNCTGLTTLNYNADSCGGDGFYVHYYYNLTNYYYYCTWLLGCTSLTTVNIGNNVRIIPNYFARGLTGLTSVSIPNSVTSIGNSAFSGCTGLTSVSIPNSVTNIGNYAFQNCSGLTSVTIPNSVTNIGNYAFQNCSGLTSVTIPNSVTSIGSNAFKYCTGLTTINYNAVNCSGDGFSYTDNWLANCYALTTVNIGDSVSSIPDFAFYGCTGLTSVTIGNSVDSIGIYAFYGCTGLTSVTIGNSVTSIGDYAFYGCTGLTGSLTIPNSVTSIGNFAFSGCTGLTSVTIGNSVTSIGNSAFSGCTGLTSVTIGNSVTSIGNSAFSGCTGLTSVTIPNSVTSIGNYAFSNCSGLTSITIPNSVNSIAPFAFSLVNNVVYNGSLYGCPWGGKNCNGYIEDSLIYSDATKTTVTGFVSGLSVAIIPNSVTSIGNYAFYNCSSLTSITIPDSVTNIGKYAFQNCSGLTSVTIPNSVTSIGNSTFSGCTGLTSVTIPNSVTSIGNSAFSGCTGLTSVTIPNSVDSIGNSAFSGCTGLTSVTIGNSVTSIGNSVFSGCTGLTSVTIPNSVDSIGNSAFSGCTGLTSVTIGNSVTYLSGFDGCTGLTSVTIPNSVTSIGNSAFYYCTGLTSVTIGNSVTSIGDWALGYCTSLTSVTIPNSVTSIGDYAFNGCTGLTSVTIPNSVTSIGGYAFRNCTGLTTLNYYARVCSGDAFRYISEAGLVRQHWLSGCTALTTVNIGNSVAIIPSYAFYYCTGLSSVTIGNSVTSIGGNAFYGCTGLTSVTIGNSVTSIGASAFNGCTGLTSVTIGNSVTSIGAAAFNGCTGLTSVTIPNSVTSIGDYAFNGCTGLTSVTIGNSVTSIGKLAFSGCIGLATMNYNAINCGGDGFTPDYYNNYNGWLFGSTALTSVNIGNSVARIPNYAFYNCTSLNSVTIPNSVTSIGEAAFLNCTNLNTINYNATNCSGDGFTTSSWLRGCSSLTRVNVGNNVRSIPENAFSICTGLRVLDLGSGLTSVGANAFYNCDHLDSIYSRSTTPPTVANTNAFENVWKGLPLTVPTGSRSAYAVAYAWRDFTNIVEMSAAQFTVTVNVNDASMGTVSGGGSYALGATATLSATANTGYRFVQWNDGNTQNPRTVTVTADATYMAFFAANQYTVAVYTNDSTMGTVTGGGSYAYGTTATLNATPNTGYTFTRWQDGNTDNPRTVTVSADATYIAFFAADQYTVTVFTNDSTMGTVTGGGTYAQGATATLTATANTGYHFVQWNDGNTQNPRTVTVTGNATYMAYFAADQSNAPQIAYVGVDSNGHNAVSWTPQAGTSPVRYNVYREGIQAGVYELVGVVNASGAASYGWTDDQSNPATRAYSYRLAEVAADNTESDLSIPHTTIHLQISQGQGDAWNLAWTPYVGFNYSTYNLYRGTDASSMTLLTTLPATATTYSDLNTGGTAYYYQIEVVQLSGAKTTAVSSRSNIVTTDPDPQTYTLTVLSADVLRGTVTGGGSYTEGTMATLTAEANEGYVFLQWQDGSTANPRNILVTANGTYMAYFTQTEGIADAEGSNVTIIARNGRIRVSGAEGRQVTLSDALGRILYRGTATEPLTVEAPATGIYLLQVEGYPAHRISVVR